MTWSIDNAVVSSLNNVILTPESYLYVVFRAQCYQSTIVSTRCLRIVPAGQG